jgi:hypothetical protein
MLDDINLYILYLWLRFLTIPIHECDFNFNYLLCSMHNFYFYFLQCYVLFGIALHSLVASVASEYSADGSTFSRSGEQHRSTCWNGRWRTVGSYFRMGQFMEDKVTITNYHETAASACSTG